MLLVVLVRPEAHSGNQNESLARKEDTGDDRGSGRTPQRQVTRATTNRLRIAVRSNLGTAIRDHGPRKELRYENSSGNVHRR